MKRFIALFIFLFLAHEFNYTNCLGSALEVFKNQELFENKTILIIGGTGYLGRFLTTEILKYSPNKVIIYSRDEVKHFYISKMFDKHKVQSIIGDVRDYQRLNYAMKGVDIVLHVAALKRMDDIEYNPEEALKTNSLATLNVFHACIENNVSKALFISTDKACLPINVYGASKFLSEKIFTNYDKSRIKTVFLVTRFGNILESTGSVIPIFSEKIKNTEDITLTDERMTRFIINKKEATDLIFDALRYGVGGEIFIPKIPAMKITDLIVALKESFKSNSKITITGLRPGEKIHEMLFNEAEAERTYEFKDRYVVIPSVNTLPPLKSQFIPEYIKTGRKLNLLEMNSYSSDKAVICKDALKSLLNGQSL